MVVYETRVLMSQGDLKGSVGVWLKLASAKMAKVPTVVKTTKIHRNMRSTTMATYCQSSFSWMRQERGGEWMAERVKTKLKKKSNFFYRSAER